MGMYAYEAVDPSGEVVKGKMEADGEATISERLRAKGLTVLEVKEQASSPLMDMLREGGTSKKVTLGDLSLFSRQLAAMLEAGIPITRSLYTLAEQTANKGLSKALQDIARNVEGGTSFSESLEGYPHIFDRLFVGMVQAGEIGGTIQETLVALAEQLNKDKALRDNIKSATFYPLIIGIFAVLVFLGMMIFMVPVFVDFFPADAELPGLTQTVVNMSDSIINYWYLYIVVFAAIFFGIRFYLKTDSGRRLWDKIVIRIPGFGQIMHKTVVARFARTFSTLIAGGIPVMQAMNQAGEAAGHSVVEDTVETAAEKVGEGKSIAEPLEESGFFPPMVTHMIAIGEETGALPDLLNRIATFFEEEVETLTRGLTAMIEPLMLIFVGGLVGFMLTSLYLPIFTVITEVM